MQNAVKAKLLELGTGAADDEIPDYIMIMVANKRSKTQMISDLNLFLGCQTELFVTWLHEVLAKLQEVTLPAISGLLKYYEVLSFYRIQKKFLKYLIFSKKISIKEQKGKLR